MEKSDFVCMENKIIEADSTTSFAARLMELFLNSRQISALKHITQNGSITSLQYREMFKVAPETAIQELLQLVDEGMVKEQSKLKFVKV